MNSALSRLLLLLAAGPVLLTGCATNCEEWGTQMVQKQICTNRSSTGHCNHFSTTYDSQRVCLRTKAVESATPVSTRSAELERYEAWRKNYPLHDAVQSGSVSLTKSLLAAGAKLDQPDDSGRYPIQNANNAYMEFENVTLGLLEVLKAHGQDFRPGYELMHRAAWLRQPELIRFLVANEVDVNERRSRTAETRGQTPLDVALSRCTPEAIAKDTNATGRSRTHSPEETARWQEKFDEISASCGIVLSTLKQLGGKPSGESGGKTGSD